MSQALRCVVRGLCGFLTTVTGLVMVELAIKGQVPELVGLIGVAVIGQVVGEYL